MGAMGPKGMPGSSGVVSATYAHALATAISNSEDYAFVSPTVTVTVDEGQVVYTSAEAGLGTLFGAGTDSGAALIVAVPLAFIAAVLWWWFTGWYLLLGHVRWRALLPGAVVTATTMVTYAVSASVWMPTVVTKNLDQFGFFGVALALVTWFSGASICLVVGACVGPVFGEDPGSIGQLSRGRTSEVLVAGAPASLGPPSQGVTLRDAFGQSDDDIGTES
jgi:hypothetical protein